MTAETKKPYKYSEQVKFVCKYKLEKNMLYRLFKKEEKKKDKEYEKKLKDKKKKLEGIKDR